MPSDVVVGFILVFRAEKKGRQEKEGVAFRTKMVEEEEARKRVEEGVACRLEQELEPAARQSAGFYSPPRPNKVPTGSDYF